MYCMYENCPARQLVSALNINKTWLAYGSRQLGLGSARIGSDRLGSTPLENESYALFSKETKSLHNPNDLVPFFQQQSHHFYITIIECTIECLFRYFKRLLLLLKMQNNAVVSLLYKMQFFISTKSGVKLTDGRTACIVYPQLKKSTLKEQNRYIYQEK